MAGSSERSSAGVVGTGPSSHFKRLCFAGKKRLVPDPRDKQCGLEEQQASLLQPQAYLPLRTSAH